MITAHIHYFSQGFNKQWHSRFITSSSVINCNFSKKHNIFLINYLVQLEIQFEKGRQKKCLSLPFHLPVFRMLSWIPSIHKVTDFLVVLQTRRIATPFSLMEVHQRWLRVAGCFIPGERRYSRFSPHISAPALEPLPQEEPFPSNG